MKKAIIISSIILVLVIGILGSLVETAKTITNRSVGFYSVYNIAIFMKDFKTDEGRYPTNLQELATLQKGDGMKLAVNNAINGWLKEGYTYKANSNGFEMHVRGFNFNYQPVTNGFILIGYFSKTYFVTNYYQDE